MPCHAMHPIQDLFLERFSYVLQFGMHFICTPMWTKFYSYKKWVLHSHELLPILILLHRMGKSTNKSATWKRVYQCWHENACEATVGIYVEL
jgi:hypothetical protein